MQSRAYDPVDPPGRRRLDPLRAAAHQQLVAHQLRPPLGLAHIGGQPPGQLVCVCHRAFPETQVRPDLGPVVLDGTAGPLIEAQVGRGDAYLAGHELHSLVRKLTTPAREPASPRVELQQQREPEPRRPALARDQLLLVIQQRPVPDELIEIQRSGHGRTSSRGTLRSYSPEPVPTR